MTEINKIYLLVHPDYDFYQRGDGYNELKLREEIELNNKWDKLVSQISNDPEAVLFYLPAIQAMEVSKLSDDTIKIRIERELDRINRYSQILRERLFFFSDLNNKSSIITAFEIRGFSFSSRLRLLVFGEYFYCCVEEHGLDLMEALSISEKRARFIKELSLDPDVSEMTYYPDEKKFRY